MRLLLSVVALGLCVPSVSTADETESRSLDERVARDFTDFFFEALVPLIGRATKTELTALLEERGMKCKKAVGKKRAICVAQPRQFFFFGRFRSGVMWAVLLISRDDDFCQVVEQQTAYRLGDPSSTKENLTLWSHEELKQETGLLIKRTHCQLIRAGKTDD